MNPHIKIDEYSLAHLNNQIRGFLRTELSPPGKCVEIDDKRRDAPPARAPVPKSATPRGGAKMMSKGLLTKTTIFIDYAKNIYLPCAEDFSSFTFEPPHGRLGL
jgi:hypothetical protein